MGQVNGLYPSVPPASVGKGAPTRRCTGRAVIALPIEDQNAELIDTWDLCIFVYVASEETLDRARTRDQGMFGSSAEVERRYRNRYFPVQELYSTTARPIDHADIIVHSDKLQQPAWAVEHADQLRGVRLLRPVPRHDP